MYVQSRRSVALGVDVGPSGGPTPALRAVACVGGFGSLVNVGGGGEGGRLVGPPRPPLPCSLHAGWCSVRAQLYERRGALCILAFCTRT